MDIRNGLLFSKLLYLLLSINLSQVENAPESDRMSLLSELEVMKKLKPHPHVIKLMGCVTESGEENSFKIMPHA